jgi:hypothetical protein
VGLAGREHNCAAIDRLLEDALGGYSGSLIMPRVTLRDREERQPSMLATWIAVDNVSCWLQDGPSRLGPPSPVR